MVQQVHATRMVSALRADTKWIRIVEATLHCMRSITWRRTIRKNRCYRQHRQCFSFMLSGVTRGRRGGADHPGWHHPVGDTLMKV